MLKILQAFFVLFLASCSGNSNPVLTIEGGKVQGVETSTDGVIVYKGIPYAAPPVGDLRWREPQPVLPWEGVKIAGTFGPAAVQNDQTPGSFYHKEFFAAGDPNRSEDCLFLNIWTPAAGNPNKKLPVAMWIHGGAYTQGFGHEIEFDGERWAERGVILVTINYRLGIYGFLAHPLLSAESPNRVSGNYGIFDQLAAIRWIKRNISQFGGDPYNLTIFGQSAGAGSVQALVASPLSAGLIQKAIIQSGGGLRGLGLGSTLENAEASGQTFFDAAGLTTLEQMRAASIEDIRKIQREAMAERRGVRTSPVIDGYLSTASFSDIVIADQLPKIPYMIGYTADDMGNMGESIRDFSLKLEELVRSGAYCYLFARPMPGDNAGAFHSAELWYIFGTLDRAWRPFNEADHRLSAKMIDYWTNFAKQGNPNGNNLPEWKPYTAAHSELMIFNIEDVFKNDEVVFRPIDNQTWIGTGNLMFNESLYLLEGNDRAILIDAGTRIANLDKIVTSITSKPVTLVATHVHPDHTGSAINCFPVIYIAPGDTVNIPMMMADYRGEVRFLKDGEIIDLGGRQIEVVFTPAHTPGSVTFVDTKAGYGFSGDSFGSGNLLLGMDFSTLIATCEKMEATMKKYNVSQLYPGHFMGRNTETPQRIRDMITLSRDVMLGKVKGEPNPNGMMGLNLVVSDYGVRINYNGQKMK